MNADKLHEHDHFASHQELSDAFDELRIFLRRSSATSDEVAVFETTIRKAADTVECFVDQLSRSMLINERAKKRIDELESDRIDYLIQQGTFLASLKKNGPVDVTRDEVTAAMKGGHRFEFADTETGNRVSAVEDAEAKGTLDEARDLSAKGSPISGLLDALAAALVGSAGKSKSKGRA